MTESRSTRTANQTTAWTDIQFTRVPFTLRTVI